VIGANETTALHAVPWLLREKQEKKKEGKKAREKGKRRANAEKVERILRYSGAFGPSLALRFYDDFYAAHSAYEFACFDSVSA